MSIYESIGMTVVFFMAALGFCVVSWAAYQHLRRTLDLATRGAIEERRDIQNVNDRRWIENIEKGFPR